MALNSALKQLRNGLSEKQAPKNKVQERQQQSISTGVNSSLSVFTVGESDSFSFEDDDIFASDEDILFSPPPRVLEDMTPISSATTGSCPLAGTTIITTTTSNDSLAGANEGNTGNHYKVPTRGTPSGLYAATNSSGMPCQLSNTGSRTQESSLNQRKECANVSSNRTSSTFSSSAKRLESFKFVKVPSKRASSDEDAANSKRKCANSSTSAPVARGNHITAEWGSDITGKSSNSDGTASMSSFQTEPDTLDEPFEITTTSRVVMSSKNTVPSAPSKVTSLHSTPSRVTKSSSMNSTPSGASSMNFAPSGASSVNCAPSGVSTSSGKATPTSMSSRTWNVSNLISLAHSNPPDSSEHLQHSVPTSTPLQTRQHSIPTSTPLQTRQHSIPTSTPLQTRQHSIPTSTSLQTRQHSIPISTPLQTRQHSIPTSTPLQTRQHSIPTSTPLQTRQHSTLTTPSLNSDTSPFKTPSAPMPLMRPAQPAASQVSTPVSTWSIPSKHTSQNKASTEASLTSGPQRFPSRGVSTTTIPQQQHSNRATPSHMTTPTLTGGVASTGTCATPLSRQPPAAMVCTPTTGGHSGAALEIVRTPVALAQRKFPGPAGLLPPLVPGQNLDNIYIPPPSIPTPASTPRGDTPSVPFPSGGGARSGSGDRSGGDDEDFEKGPWVQMMEDLDLNGSYSSALLDFSISKAIKKFVKKSLTNGKVVHLRVMLKSIISTGRNASAILKDPSGEVMCTVHSRVLEEHQRDFQPGAVLVLRQVTMFSPGHRKYYLNITPPNIVAIYPPDKDTVSMKPLDELLAEIEEQDRNNNVTNFPRPRPAASSSVIPPPKTQQQQLGTDSLSQAGTTSRSVPCRQRPLNASTTAARLIFGKSSAQSKASGSMTTTQSYSQTKAASGPGCDASSMPTGAAAGGVSGYDTSSMPTGAVAGLSRYDTCSMPTGAAAGGVSRYNTSSVSTGVAAGVSRYDTSSMPTEVAAGGVSNCDASLMPTEQAGLVTIANTPRCEISSASTGLAEFMRAARFGASSATTEGAGTAGVSEFATCQSASSVPQYPQNDCNLDTIANEQPRTTDSHFFSDLCEDEFDSLFADMADV